MTRLVQVNKEIKHHLEIGKWSMIGSVNIERGNHIPVVQGMAIMMRGIVHQIIINMDKGQLKNTVEGVEVNKFQHVASVYFYCDCVTLHNHGTIMCHTIVHMSLNLLFKLRCKCDTLFNYIPY